LIYDALINGIDLENKKYYELEYESQNIFCNKDIFGFLYSDIRLFYSRDLFNEFVKKSLNYCNSEEFDKTQELLKALYVKKSIRLLNDFLNIVKSIIDKEHEKHDYEYIISMEVQQLLSAAILKKCNELSKDGKEALQYLSYHEQYINSTLNEYRKYLEELSERNLQPSYPKSIFLQSEKLKLGENNFLDMTNFAKNLKDNSSNEEVRDYFEIFIGYSQIILAHIKAIDDISRKSLKNKVEEWLNEFCRHIEIPRFLVDIICSENFEKMIDHQKVITEKIKILDELSEYTKNDITDFEFKLSELFTISEHDEYSTSDDACHGSQDDCESCSHSSFGSDQSSLQSQYKGDYSNLLKREGGRNKSTGNAEDATTESCRPFTTLNQPKAQNFSYKRCCVIS
jgi:hypothetical protein